MSYASRPPLTKETISSAAPAVPRAALVAGALAGLTLAVDDKSRRMALALYISTRTLEFAYNYLNKRGYLPTVPHGDTLVMAIASAQIIYALVFEQDTLAVRTVASARARSAGERPANLDRRPCAPRSAAGGRNRTLPSCSCTAGSPSTASSQCRGSTCCGAWPAGSAWTSRRSRIFSRYAPAIHLVGRADDGHT